MQVFSVYQLTFGPLALREHACSSAGKWQFSDIQFVTAPLLRTAQSLLGEL